MKVCHITSAHKSQDVRILKKQCISLATAGYEVYLIAGGESYIEHGVNVIGIGEVGGGRLNRMLTITNILYKTAIKINCDIYQLHDPELLPCALKLKKRGKKVIFDSHEDYVTLMDTKKYIPFVFRKPVKIIYKIFSQYVFNCIDAILFPCLKNGENIFSNLCKRSVIIGNEPKLDELYDQFDNTCSKKNNLLCYVGSLTYNRGIFHISKAAIMAKSKLILAGAFSDKIFEKNILEESACSIDYRGTYNRNELVEILKEASVGISTMLNIGQYNTLDNLNTKVYEYMSMGLPVIISDYSYARKINEKYNFAILVTPDSVEEISNAIKELTGNPILAKQMGLNGRRAIKEEFNWANEEKKLLNLYKELSDEIRTDRLR